MFTPLSGNRAGRSAAKSSSARKAGAGSFDDQAREEETKPGRYRLTLQAADKAGNKSK